MSEHATDAATETFLTHRNLLCTVAYEMLTGGCIGIDRLSVQCRWR